MEAECNMKPERRLFALLSSPPLSLVVKDDVEMIDRRFAMLGSLFLASIYSLSLSGPFSFSSSPEEEEREDLGLDGKGMTPMVPREIVDGVDEEGGESEVESES